MTPVLRGHRESIELILAVLYRKRVDYTVRA
jgi:hypothetical protein